MSARDVSACLFLSLILAATCRPIAANEQGAPARMPEEGICHYDMTALQGLDLNEPDQLRRYHDEAMLVASLQGLVNRKAPRLFVRFNTEPDDFWWSQMSAGGGWLEGRTVWRISGDMDALLGLYESEIKGLAFWDERVPATSLLAATVAGAEDLLVVRHDASTDSLCGRLTSREERFPVCFSALNADGSPLFCGEGLIPGTRHASTGSAKNDVYRWMLEHYIQPGRLNTATLGYYLDGFCLKCPQASAPWNHTVHNLDYIIAHRGILFDLNVWEDETPVDDPDQKPGTDLETLQMLLRACCDLNGPDRMMHISGFIPWAFKYTNHRSDQWDAGGKHDPVPTEWKYAEVITAYNGYMDADALSFSSFPNASFYQHFPLPDFIPQDAPPSRESLIASGILDQDGKLLPVNYYAHYQGDYDAAAWVYWNIPRFYQDPTRGSVPLSWAINPSLARRFGFGLHWMRKNRMPGEVFIAGEGAGYLNPSLLSPPRPYSGLPDGLPAWEAHNTRFYRQWDIRVTGFSIDGDTPSMDERTMDAYARFSPGGLGLQRGPAGMGLHGDMPYIVSMGDLPGGGDMARCAEMIRRGLVSGRPGFLYFRSILQAPSFYADLDHLLHEPGNPPVKLVDVPTLMWLVREYHQHKAEYLLSSPYAQAASVFATPEESTGLRPVKVEDGKFTEVATEHGLGWRFPDREGSYIYFDVDDGFVEVNRAGGFAVEFEFVVAGNVDLLMQYDSRDTDAPLGGAYKDARPVVDSPGKGDAPTRLARLELPDALFQNRQNGWSDLRIQCLGAPAVITRMVVKPSP